MGGGRKRVPSMRYDPPLEVFAELAQQYTMVPVYRQLTGDTLTPVTAFGRLAEGEWSFLFESVVGGERVGRYSFLGSGPFLRLEAYDRRVRWQGSEGEGGEEVCADPLRRLEELWSRYRAPHLAELPRFCGGIVGYAGYDTVRYVERLPQPPPDDRGLPDLSFGFYDRMVIFDHVDKTVRVVAHARIEPGMAASRAALEAAYARAGEQVDRLVERLQQVRLDWPLRDIAPRSAEGGGGLPTRVRSNFTPEQFAAAVDKARAYIHAGDAFQIVLSQRFETTTTARPFDIYRALRVVSPSPFMFYLRCGPATLIGASPEIMCRVENGLITSRPLAGTRRRGRTPQEDQALAEELRRDPKERAEHIMLVDLARNDVGRVAEIGSVQLSDLLTVEYYSHVMHLSSTVTGRLRPGLTAFDALRASLPAGTLSGAPKVRAMEIIDELEPHRRGPYGGAVGYVDFSGNMDTCIALRTMVLLGSTAYVQAGAGIVADSQPELEYQETVNKARALLRAIDVAETQL